MATEPPESVLRSVIEGFSLQPIATSAVSILKDLTPLLAPNSSLGSDVTKELKQVLEQVTTAVRYNCVVVHYFAMGIHGLYRTLVSWNEDTASMKRDQFLMVVKHFRYAYANAMDAQPAYAVARKDVEALVGKYLESFGSDAVIEVAAKHSFTGELNIRKSSLQNMGTSIISHLETSEATTEACINLLREIDIMLVSFLGNEQFSLTQPLASIPIWSEIPAETWGLLNTDVGETENNLIGHIHNNPTWFKWGVEDKNLYLEKDEEAREAQITSPDVKLQVPDDEDIPTFEVKPRQTSVPSQIIEATIKPSGICLVRLASLDCVKNGVSRLMFAVDISGSISEALEHIIIRCERGDDNASVQFVDLGWKGIKDVPTSTNWWLRHSKPRLKTSVTQRKAEWTITRPIFYWRFIFPPSFTLSMDVAYEVECILEAEVIFVYQGVFKRKRVSFDCSLRLPEGTTPTASKDP